MAKKKKYNFEQVVIDKNGNETAYEGSKQQFLDNRYNTIQTIKNKIAEENFNTLKKNRNIAEDEFDKANSIWKNKVVSNRNDKSKQILSYEDKKDNRTVKTENLIDDSNKAFESANEEYKQKEAARNKYALADYYYNREKYNDKNYKPGFIQEVYDKSIGRALRGAGEMLLNFGGRDNEKYIDENGKTVYLPSELELKNQTVRKKYGNDVAGKIAAGLGDVSENLGKIGGATALDAVTFGYGGTLAYNNDIAQRAYKNAINEGADEKMAVANATIGTGSEILTGKILGSATKGLTKFGGNTLAETQTGSAFENFLEKQIGKKVSNKTIRKILAAGASEATEEGLQEYIDALNNKLTLGKDINLKDTSKNAIYSAIVGGLTGGIINTPGAIRNNRINSNINNEIYTKNNLLANLDDQARIIQEEYKKGNISSEEANTQMQTIIDKQQSVLKENSNQGSNSLYNITEDLKNDITNKTRKNIKNTNDAMMVPIEQVLPYKNDGGYRTEKQINDLLSDIKNDGIINPIELSKNSDGTYSIDQGNHRLQIAQKLGLKEVPIKVVNKKLENLNNQSYNNSIGGVDDGRTNSNREIFDRYYEGSRNIENNNNNNSDEFKTGISKNRNDRVRSEVEEYNNGSPSATAYEKNITKSKELNSSSFSLPEVKEGYTRLYRGLQNEYDPNYDRSILDSPNGYDTLTDNYDLAKEYGDNVYYIDVPTKSVANSVIDENPNSETYGDRNLLYKNDKPAGLRGVNGNEYLLYTDHDSFNSNDYHKINNNQSNNKTNSGNKLKLDQRVSGDTLLDAQDLIEEIKSVGAKVDDNGYVTVYHQTTPENAKKIKETGKMISKENDIFFSTSKNATQAEGRGNIKLEFKIPAEKLELDDLFSDNADVKISLNGKNNLDVSEYMTNDTKSIKEKNNPDTLYENKDIGDVLAIKNNVKNKPLTKKTTSDEINYVLSGNKNESKFLKNITENSKFITEENRNKLSKENIKYYDKVTNKESLAEAQERLDNMGENAIVDFFSNKKNVDSVDVATGWILLKRFQDVGDYDSMVEVAKKMRSMGTKSGQAVQAFNIMQRLTPEGMVKYAQSELMEAYDNYSKNKTKKWIDENREDFGLTPDETQFIVDTMKKVETMEDGYSKKVELAKIQKMLQDKLPPEKGQGIKSWMRISMLFNPKTQIRNIVGNAAITPVNAVSDVFSAAVDKILAKKTGVRTTGMANIGAYLKGSKQGAYEATNDFKLGINTKNINQNRFEVGQGKAFNEKMQGVKSIFNPINKAGNKIDSMLNYALDVGDRVFSQGAFNQSIQNQMILNNTNKITQDMVDIAEQEALSRTWNDDNNYTKFVLDVRRGLNKIGPKSYGLGDILIPFAKTPANLTKAIVDYSPAGLVTSLLDVKNVKNNIEMGTLTPQMQHEFAQRLGKATAGTLLYILGTALAKAKVTSGGNDDDKEVSDFMRNTLGIQPYSIKIGNKSFTYDWMQPAAAPFAITADLEKKKGEKQNLHDAISSVADTGFNLLMEQSFMQSINDVLSGYGSKFEKIEDQVYGLPARSLPTFLKQINDMIDSKTRMVYEKNSKLQSGINQVKTKTPGLSESLPIKRDTLGREINKYGGENNIFNVFINPANVQKGKLNESAKEIYDVYKITKDNRIMPRQPASQLGLDNKEISEFLKISGKIVNDNVKKLKHQKYYKDMTAYDKADVIKDIVDYAYNKAKAKVTGNEISKNYKTAEEIISSGVPVYDYYANKKENRYYYSRKYYKK